MAGKYERSRKRRLWPVLLLLVLAGLLCFLLLTGPDRQDTPPDSTTLSDGTESATVIQTASPETAAPSTEPAHLVSTASIGATGDLLLHELVIKSGYEEETGEYNYDNIFTWLAGFVSQVDYAAANLEVTLAGDENGREYTGYPCFNAPDAIVDAAKAAGFDLLLTANNHSYDTGFEGFMRTQQVIRERELAHIGTRLNVEDENYIIRDINGIRVGMTCYTYCSAHNSAGNVMLNGLPLSREASQLVNSFHYKKLDAFYDKLGAELEQMKAEGAEALVVFIHWGDEYKTSPNATQQQMAQALCDLGVDVIVGNHAHVVQPVELLTSRVDDSRRTLCLYSTGNCVSNIYASSTRPVHTEDGMLFTFTFAKYSDGTVLVERAEVLPTWVWRYDDEAGIRKFRIMTMPSGTDWAVEMELELDEELAEKCRESFRRTMDIVGEGLEDANAWFSRQQAETENRLGIR